MCRCFFFPSCEKRRKSFPSFLCAHTLRRHQPESAGISTIKKDQPITGREKATQERKEHDESGFRYSALGSSVVAAAAAAGSAALASSWGAASAEAAAGSASEDVQRVLHAS